MSIRHFKSVSSDSMPENPSRMEEKWKTDERGMRKRGLEPDATDREYLDWWEMELGVK